MKIIIIGETGTLGRPVVYLPVTDHFPVKGEVYPGNPNCASRHRQVYWRRTTHWDGEASAAWRT